AGSSPTPTSRGPRRTPAGAARARPGRARGRARGAKRERRPRRYSSSTWARSWRPVTSRGASVCSHVSRSAVPTRRSIRLGGGRTTDRPQLELLPRGHVRDRTRLGDRLFETAHLVHQAMAVRFVAVPNATLRHLLHLLRCQSTRALHLALEAGVGGAHRGVRR